MFDDSLIVSFFKGSAVEIAEELFKTMVKRLGENTSLVTALGKLTIRLAAEVKDLRKELAWVALHCTDEELPESMAPRMRPPSDQEHEIVLQ